MRAIFADFPRGIKQFLPHSSLCVCVEGLIMWEGGRKFFIVPREREREGGSREMTPNPEPATPQRRKKLAQGGGGGKKTFCKMEEKRDRKLS